MNPNQLRGVVIAWLSASACAQPQSFARRRDGAPLVSTPSEISQSATREPLFRLHGTSRIQTVLQQKGYAVDKTGALDEKTRTALVAFQEDHHLPPTGMPDIATLRKLDVDPDELLRDDKKVSR